MPRYHPCHRSHSPLHRFLALPNTKVSPVPGQWPTLRAEGTAIWRSQITFSEIPSSSMLPNQSKSCLHVLSSACCQQSAIRIWDCDLGHCILHVAREMMAVCCNIQMEASYLSVVPSPFPQGSFAWWNQTNRTHKSSWADNRAISDPVTAFQKMTRPASLHLSWTRNVQVSFIKQTTAKASAFFGIHAMYMCCVCVYT